jgi:hypothetical protein
MADFDDEIVVRDPTGRFRVLRGGKFYDLEEKKPAPTVLPPAVLSKIIKDSKIVFEERLGRRFAEIVEAFFKDVRDKFETKTTLIKKVEEGGMGFVSEQADLVIKLIEVERGKGLKVEKVEGVERLKGLKVERVERAGEEVISVPAAVPPVAPTPVVARVQTPKVLPSAMATALTRVPAVSSGVAEFVFSPADEAEILAHAQKLPVVMAGLKPVEVARFVNEIVKKSGVMLDDVSRKKLEKILLTHLKDIRDGFETQETLGSATAGIALTPEAMGKILTAAKVKFQELDEKLKKEQLEKIKAAMEGEKMREEAARQGAEAKVKDKIEERWRQITKKTGAPVALPTELISPPIGLRPKVSAIAPPAPLSILKAAPPLAVVKPTVEEVSVTGEKVEREKGLKVEKEKITVGAAVGTALAEAAGAPEEKPKPLQVFKPAAPVRRPIPKRVDRPRLDDVKYAPKLVGPVEELREMTLVDFRRLSPDPRAAILKIREKINLLEKESITKKIAGIRAWQESEVPRLYLEISRESLTKGVPVNQVISILSSAGKSTLTNDEYQAVMELNRVLRY